MDDSQPIFESKAFCWCGMDDSPETTALEMVPSLYSKRDMEFAPAAKVEGGLGLCHNGYDIGRLKPKPKWMLHRDTFLCAQKADGDSKKGAQCMMWKELISPLCSTCFGAAISCSFHMCKHECACSPSPPLENPFCHSCVETFCKAELNYCTGLPVDSEANLDVLALPAPRHANNTMVTV